MAEQQLVGQNIVAESLECCPPLPPFVPCVVEGSGQGFAGDAYVGFVQNVSEPGVSDGTMGWVQYADAAGGGWYSRPTLGPVSKVEASGPFFGLRADDNIRVRIEAIFAVGTLTTGPKSVTAYLMKNGSEILDTQVSTAPAGVNYFTPGFHFDLPSVPLLAGDVITCTFDGSEALWWGALTTNLQCFQMGRGTHVWNSGTVTWEGPGADDAEIPGLEIPCEPGLGQGHVEEFTGDGVASAFQTGFPYAEGVIGVTVNGLAVWAAAADPSMGWFGLPFVPEVGAIVLVHYRNAGTLATGGGGVYPVSHVRVPDHAQLGTGGDGSGVSVLHDDGTWGPAGVATTIWAPVMATRPDIVTTTGGDVWVPLVTVDGQAVMAEVPL